MLTPDIRNKVNNEPLRKGGILTFRTILKLKGIQIVLVFTCFIGLKCIFPVLQVLIKENRFLLMCSKKRCVLFLEYSIFLTMFSILQVYVPNSKGDAIIFQCPVCPTEMLIYYAPSYFCVWRYSLDTVHRSISNW